MRFKVNRILKRIKRSLIRKVILNSYYTDKEYINYELELINFWNPKKEIEIQFINGEQIKKLPYKLNENILMIQVPQEFLYAMDLKVVIKLMINKKEMLITPFEGMENYAENIIINNRYFTTNINKDIIIRNRHNEYVFNTQWIIIQDLQLNYDFIQFTLKNANLPINGDSEIMIYAFNNNRVREVHAEYDHKNKIIELQDFTLFSIGLWEIFVSINHQLFPLGFKEKVQGIFETYHHRVSLINKNGVANLLFQPHILQCDTISIDRDDDGKVVIGFREEEFRKEQEYTFLVNDTKNDQNISLPLYRKDNLLFTKVPLDTLYENFTDKRFFIVSNEKKPFKYQFNLDKEKLLGTGVSTNEVVGSELINLLFYRRKDNSLGLKISRPRLKKIITGIENFVLNGFIGSLDKFVDCTAYLLVEERNTLTSFKVPIKEKFKIDLLQLDLIALKGKDKTIMDLFVLIKNNKDEVIRKEKIKYKYADYKKDNYYNYKAIKDRELKQHHFLITTTPFDNLKIETFSISNSIVIPEDTSQKDDNIWLIGERYNTAQDNGIVFFHWLQENTTIDAYYVIESDATDYEKIKDNPNVLIFGSQKHFDISIRAKVLLGTHDLENILPYKPSKGFFHYENTYKVLLQHGVLGRKNVEYHKRYYEQPFDLFIVSSNPEKYEVVMEEFGYEEQEVAVTGLARFDNLVQVNEPRDILLMPTWRDWINTNEQFLGSEYYTTYLNLIKNPKLINLLEKYNVNLNFYPHYRAQGYFNKDLPNLNERIRFIQLGSKTVQNLLIDHALLITDYSSVSFDFSLMDKPVIYYHFDAKRFFRRGILRPIEETFIGRIARSEEEIVGLIGDRLEHNFGNYDLDISNIIKYQDKHNSERIYKVIKSNLSKR